MYKRFQNSKNRKHNLLGYNVQVYNSEGAL
jgi:hypothetical protein